MFERGERAAWIVVATLVGGCPPGSRSGDDCGGQCAPGVTQCALVSQCDDGDLCTNDECDSGCCKNAPVRCEDDGQFCTGAELCDGATGRCVSTGTPCGAEEWCDEIEDTCTPDESGLSVTIEGCPSQLAPGESIDLVAVPSESSSVLAFQWELLDGQGSLDGATAQTARLTVSTPPGGGPTQVVVQVTAA